VEDVEGEFDHVKEYLDADNDEDMADDGDD